jgi:hypothetical protein
MAQTYHWDAAEPTRTSMRWEDVAVVE